MPLSSTAFAMPGVCRYMSVKETVPLASISAMPRREPQ